MYSFVLALHSVLRWLVIATALFAVARALLGVIQKRPFTTVDRRAGLALVATMDLQLVFGLLLYFAVSPLTTAALADFGAAMKNKVLRFWAVEHLTMMIAAIALVHVGRVLVRKGSSPHVQHKRALLWFGLATLLVVAGIPWPFLPYGRPLFGPW